ncbi:MAG: thioredoxin domain-containing protein [Anaerolineae bacterium]
MLSAEPQIKETYVKTGLVKLIFAPVLNHGDRSLQTHQAAECAADQGRFWDMHNILFENQQAMFGGDVQATVKQLAAQNGFDTAAFNACLDEQRTLARVQAQDEIRKARGIRGQPVFDINGSYLIGAQPYDVYATVINESLP